LGTPMEMRKATILAMIWPTIMLRINWRWQ
jgi:hypothetical protein